MEEKIIDSLYVGNGASIATKEIQEIENPEDREYEVIPENLSSKGGI